MALPFSFFLGFPNTIYTLHDCDKLQEYNAYILVFCETQNPFIFFRIKLIEKEPITFMQDSDTNKFNCIPSGNVRLAETYISSKEYSFHLLFFLRASQECIMFHLIYYDTLLFKALLS